MARRKIADILKLTPILRIEIGNKISSELDGPRVLDVVKSNYDTLTLKLYDNLDQYEKYTEKLIETAFFTPLTLKGLVEKLIVVPS
ncbi:hypothetical protein TNCV_2378061 [Trichonephila clavipes]|nr:hypothetical protein TNCV_2378061 [Trichonephila clavipes]